MAATKKTNAVRILEGMKIPFELLEYDIDENELSAEDAAAKTGIAEERTFKTLCCRGDRSGVIMVCVPAGRELDFKALAAASGNKSAELVHLKEVQGLTGYIRGGCSPIGMKKAFVKMIEIMMKEATDPENRHLVITHCNCPERAHVVRDMILKKIPFKDSLIMDTNGISSLYASDGGIIVTC